MTQRPDITLEFEETVVLKQGGKLLTDFCPQCGETVDMLSPDVLSLVSGISEREIFRFVENATIYFVESGRIVACLSCLQRKAGDSVNTSESEFAESSRSGASETASDPFTSEGDRKHDTEEQKHEGSNL